MIYAYPRRPSVRAGTTLTLHVSTDQPQFRVEFYRQAAQLERMPDLASEPLKGVHCLQGPTDQDWGWPAYSFAIPSTWPSGIYVAMLIAVDADAREHAPDRTTVDGTDAKALFVVMPAQPGEKHRILYKLAWNTFHAYNGTGYGSLYAEAMWSSELPRPGFKITTRRPGGGTGGVVEPGNLPDDLDPTGRRQTFGYWDAAFVAWLEREGYGVDYCTDLDVHEDESLLASYRLLLSVGHDEYWSERMRRHIEGFISRGGNVAFFSGNICGYRIHYADGNSAIVCAKVAAGPGERGWELDHWDHLDAQQKVTGVTTLCGGWWEGDGRQRLGYTVQHADHWIYEGTGLRDGDEFGGDRAFPLIGYEVDGADFRYVRGLARPKPSFGAPATFFILGVAELGPGWLGWSPRAAATMGTYTSAGGGCVFQAAVTDWPILVIRNQHVERITRNVLDHLGLASVRVIGPLPARAGRTVAVEGSDAAFHVDTGDLLHVSSLHYEWRIVGAHADAGDQPTLRVSIPRCASSSEPATPVTVSVVIRDGQTPLAFGTCTFVPLTEEEALQFDSLVLTNDIANQNGPQGPIVGPRLVPTSATGQLISARVPRVMETADRLAQVTRKLREHQARRDQPENKTT
jgi:hypothetical protein